MSMYLSNSDLGPTGVEPGEFLDEPSFAVAQRAEEEAESSRRVEVAGHRLNVLAAMFLPLTALCAFFGMELHNGLEPWDQKYAPLPMLAILAVGLVLGAALTAFITRKP
jgi:hypothetical protein